MASNSEEQHEKEKNSVGGFDLKDVPDQIEEEIDESDDFVDNFSLQFGRIVEDSPTDLVPMDGENNQNTDDGRALELYEQNSYSERFWKRSVRDSFCVKEKIFAISDGEW